MRAFKVLLMCAFCVLIPVRLDMLVSESSGGFAIRRL